MFRILVILFTISTSAWAAEPLQAFHLNSSAFNAGAAVPSIYTSGGGNQMPPLNWYGEPSGTRGYALLVTDLDAPLIAGKEASIRWLVYGIPEGSNDIRGALRGGAHQAVNSLGLASWSGPFVSSEGGAQHRYAFRLFALNALLYFPFNASSEEVLGAINGHILGEAQLITN